MRSEARRWDGLRVHSGFVFRRQTFGAGASFPCKLRLEGNRLAAVDARGHGRHGRVPLGRKRRLLADKISLIDGPSDRVKMT
jgi:hypothetical protein